MPAREGKFFENQSKFTACEWMFLEQGLAEWRNFHSKAANLLRWAKSFLRELAKARIQLIRLTSIFQPEMWKRMEHNILFHGKPIRRPSNCESPIEFKAIFKYYGIYWSESFSLGQNVFSLWMGNINARAGNESWA